MIANPGKFQIIFIRSSINNNNITFIVEKKHIKRTISNNGVNFWELSVKIYKSIH